MKTRVALCLSLLLTLARAGSYLGGDHEVTLSTGIYSGNGAWDLKVGETPLSLQLEYDEKGRLVGTGTAAGVQIPVAGKIKLKKRGLLASFKGTDRKLARLRLKATVDGGAGQVSGTGTLGIRSADVAEKKSDVTGTIPAGSTDVATVALSLAQDGAGVLSGTCRVVVPSGRMHDAAVRGKMKSSGAVKMSAKKRLLKVRGRADGTFFEGRINLRAPGFRVKKLPLSLKVETTPDYDGWQHVPGESWTWRVKGTGETFTTSVEAVSEKVGGRTVYRVVRSDSPPGRGIYTGFDSQHGAVDVATDSWDIFDPSDVERLFWNPPLYRCRYGDQVGRKVEWAGQFESYSRVVTEVLAYEKVKVPAGTYSNAMKFRETAFEEHGDTWDQPLLFWSTSKVGLVRGEETLTGSVLELVKHKRPKGLTLQGAGAGIPGSAVIGSIREWLRSR